MFAPKDLPPIIINEPVRDLSGNIKLAVVHEPEKIDVQVISRPYDPNAPPLELDNLNTNDQSSQISVVHLDPSTQEQEQTHSPDDVLLTH